MKQIHEQCEAWGMKLTGHLVLEESLLSQLVSNGACMPHYEYMDIPGMDWLGRGIGDCLTARQVSSAAEQMGKESVLSETFACCGHNVSFAELKGIYEWQMVRGINLMCPHLEGYSIRGLRKRDYPPAMYIQQPWWKVYGRLVEALSRESMILAEGEKRVDVLLLHPQTTAWTLYNDTDHSAISKLDQKFLDTIKALERKHIVFHLGDETMMERHGKIEDGKLCIGKQRYTHVIDSCCQVLLPNTQKLLDEFRQGGGHIIGVEDLPANEIIDAPEITYARRGFEGCTVHYFVNSSPEERTAAFRVAGKVIDIYTGDTAPFSGRHTFEPWGSLMILEEDGAEVQTAETAVPETMIALEKDFVLAEPVQNCLTLDRCDYYFDGELQEKNGYVLNIAERANALGRAVRIHQDYSVEIHHVPKELYLVCETPEKFKITVNGRELTQKPAGYFADKSFRKLDITAWLRKGSNQISFDCEFKQPDEFHENLKKALVFESERNKLSPEMEIEAIYLVGDFRVRTEGQWTELDRNAVRYHGGFELDPVKREISLKHMEQQGYPFFCGEMALEGELEVTGENPVLKLERRGVTAVKVEIGGRTRFMLTNDKMPLKEFGVQGTVKVKLTLINNLRNLLGPHHLIEGESYGVGPDRFFKEKCVWNKDPEKDWCDDYCFVEMSI